MTSIEWCAGLFAGEGHARMVTRVGPSSGRVLTYPSYQLTMLDRGSVALFAEHFRIRVQDYRYSVDASRRIYRCSSAGIAAGSVLNALLPHLAGTEKHEQVVCAFLDADWMKNQSTGLYEPPTDRRSKAMIGNTNRKKSA